MLSLPLSFVEPAPHPSEPGVGHGHIGDSPLHKLMRSFSFWTSTNRPRYPAKKSDAQPSNMLSSARLLLRAAREGCIFAVGDAVQGSR